MALLRCVGCGAFAPDSGCPHCGSKQLATAKKVLAAAAVGASVFMILPGCAYGCPPDACGRDDLRDSGRVSAQPEIQDGSSVDDASTDAGPSDAGMNGDAKDAGGLDASIDGG